MTCITWQANDLILWLVFNHADAALAFFMLIFIELFSVDMPQNICTCGHPVCIWSSCSSESSQEGWSKAEYERGKRAAFDQWNVANHDLGKHDPCDIAAWSIGKLRVAGIIVGEIEYISIDEPSTMNDIK